MNKIIIVCLLLFSPLALSSTGPKLLSVDIDLQDKAAIKRGANLFTSYCVNCHSAAFMRYNRLGQDLGMSDEEVAREFIHTDAKVGDTMTIALQPEDAKAWFGVVPPDLSVIARYRGTDWLYTYLQSFYRDDERPWGVNNAIFKDVAMPHVLWELQGLQEPVWETEHTPGGEQRVLKGLKLVEPGTQTPEEYDQTVKDLVTFLAYLSEPSKLQRLQLGKWVILFLVVFLILSYLLKREYWKDIH